MRECSFLYVAKIPRERSPVPLDSTWSESVKWRTVPSHNLFKVLYATGMSFRHFGVSLDVSEGMAALERVLMREDEFE